MTKKKRGNRKKAKRKAKRRGKKNSNKMLKILKRYQRSKLIPKVNLKNQRKGNRKPPRKVRARLLPLIRMRHLPIGK